MNFTYVNLPKLPSNFINYCLKNVSLAQTDEKLIELNKKEGISHSITYLPNFVKFWIIKKIIPLIDPKLEHPELIDNMFLHINKYIEHSEGNGIHPIHIDYGRKYAFNYILTLGAIDPPTTTWYLNDKKTIIEEHRIESEKWHFIAVNPVWHGVKGQEKGQLRTIISLCFNPKNIETFDPKIYFKNIIL